MFDPKKFTAPKPKALPLFLLLDVSGSMLEGGKIEALNQSVSDMLESFATLEKMEREIMVSVITFGEEVNLHVPLTKASDIKWQDLEAGGYTPMGTAMKMVKAMIEDRSIIPSRSYKPMIVLVSDGQPNDDWKSPMKDLINNGRSSKCGRMALAIGSDADESVLNLFIEGSEYKLFYSEDASRIKDFFKYVTMTVDLATKTGNDNSSPVGLKPTDGSKIKTKPQSQQINGTEDESYDEDLF